MEAQLLRQIRNMKIYLAVITFLFILAVIYAFNFNNRNYGSHPHFSEIDVERMNIVERNGKLKMVISNQEKQSPGVFNGKTLAARNRPPGIIFFNTDGDECGGLVYDGDKKSSLMVLSIDQYKQDQVMQLQYARDKDDRHYGLKMWDRPDNFSLSDLVRKNDSLKKLNDPAAYKTGIGQMQSKGLIGTERLFIGKNASGEVGLFIKDSKGIPRIRLYVDKNGSGKIEFLK
jgi:hypothetical protein